MATSSEIKQRAKALAEKTDVNSITPREVGGIMYDLASHSENVLRNGGTLGIRKVYESVAAMEADSTNPKDFWGDPIKKGNLVVIYDGTTTGVDNNKTYAFLKPGWKIATHLDAGYATKASLDAAIENVLLQFRDSENALNKSISNLEETVTGNKKEVDAKLSELGSKIGYEQNSIPILSSNFFDFSFNGTTFKKSATYKSFVYKLNKGEKITKNPISASYMKSVRLFNKEPKIDGVDYDMMSVNLTSSSPIIEYNESYPYLVIGYDFANYADTDILIIYPYGIKKDILDINKNLVSVNEKIEELRTKAEKLTVTDMTPLLVDGYRNKSNRTFTPSDTIKTAEFTVLAGDLIESNTMVVETVLVGCCLLGSSNETIKAISTQQAQSYIITDEDIAAGVVKASWCYRTTTQTTPFYLRMTRVIALIEEAPKDGKQYVRKDGNWVVYSSIDEDSIFPLKGKKIVCFGDSQTENSDSSNKGIADYLAELSKATTVRGGVGGTRLSVRSSIVAEPTTSDECYAILDIPNLVDAWCKNEWTLVDKAVTWLKNNASDNNTSVITRLKDNPIETTDIVIVMGGGNNADDSTFGNHGDNDINHLSGGIDYIIKRLYETKPTLSVYFFNPPPRVKPMLTDPTNPIWSDEYRVNSGDGSLSFPNLCKKIIEVATKNHVPCCDLYHNCGVTRWNVSTYANGSDTVHLTKAFPKYANLQYSFILANKNF